MQVMVAMRNSVLSVVTVALVSLGSACVGNPVPEPPHALPVDLDKLGTSQDESDERGVYGAEGAVEPNIEVWIWNLLSAEGPGISTSHDDGSFYVEVPFSRGDDLRLQLRAERERSIPVDMEIESSRWVQVSRSECIDIPDELDLGAVAQSTLSLRNQCSGAVELMDYRWRMGASGLSTEIPTFGPIEGGGVVEVNISDASDGSFVEDIVIVVLEIDGHLETHVVSVYANGG